MKPALTKLGALAQLGERIAGSDEVRGSIPLGSTNTDFYKPLYIKGFLVTTGCEIHIVQSGNLFVDVNLM